MNADERRWGRVAYRWFSSRQTAQLTEAQTLATICRWGNRRSSRLVSLGGMRCLLVALLALFVAGSGLAGPARILILTGANNHDWRATTPVLKSILEADGRLVVAVTTNVPGLTPEVFGRYDALLSNFNRFGQHSPTVVWDATMRAALVNYIRSGHGFVVVHAGSAGFYDWPEFQTVAGVTWAAGTSHGKMHTNEIHILGSGHPVTAGMTDFTTFDEFWQHAPLQPDAVILAEVMPKREFGGSGRPEPMAVATTLGQGRGFTLLLGHDVRAMTSPGFKQLLQRGTEWAATGSVTPATAELKSKP